MWACVIFPDDENYIEKLSKQSCHCCWKCTALIPQRHPVTTKILSLSKLFFRKPRNRLINIFKSYLHLEHVSEKWKMSKVDFPIAVRIQHTTIKYYRLACLTSQCWKLTYENILATMDAPIKGRLTNSVLHSMVGTIEKSLETIRLVASDAIVDVKSAD